MFGCYVGIRLTKNEDVMEHLLAIQKLFENDPDPNPMTHVNTKVSLYIEKPEMTSK